MKCTFLIISMFFVLLSHGQIGEVQTGREGIVIGTGNGKKDGLPELRKHEIRGQDYYILTYRNMEYTSIIDIQNVGFYATPEELEYLYQFILGGFDTDENRTLEVGDAKLGTYKFLSRQVAVYISQHGKPQSYTYLNRKWLDRLFGKDR